MALTCTEVGCNARAGKTGLCSKHWFAKRSNGTLAHLPKCTIEKCRRCAVGNGLCALHYRRQKRGKPLEPEHTRRPRSPGAPCESPACDRKASARGLCSAHWTRWSLGQPLDTPIRRRARLANRTDRRINQFGYAVRYAPSSPMANGAGYVLEHRLIVAESIGRPLLPRESVHHKNGDRQDNRLVKGHELYCPSTCCNLELWSTSQPSGQRVEDKVAWAREILALYEPQITRTAACTGT